jgi:hypothetical protein
MELTWNVGKAASQEKKEEERGEAKRWVESVEILDNRLAS